MDNYGLTILSQYGDSPIIKSLIESFNDALDPSVDIDLFYNEVFNITTAKTYGLDIWGRILGIGRYFEVVDDRLFFGLLGSRLQPFNQAPFYDEGVTNTYRLGDDAYRQLLLLKAMANVSDTSIPSLNRILNQFYQNRGRAYIIESGLMKIRYVFEFLLQPFERALMRRVDIPPKPAGVGFEVLEVPPKDTFGFFGSNLQPFNQGVFNVGVYNGI